MRSNIILHAVCAFLLVVAVSLTGCGKSDTVGKGDAGRVVTDTTGREVHLPSEIKSLAIVPIPWASVVYAVDGTGQRIAGMHPSAKASYEKSMLKTLAPELAGASTDFVGQDFSIHMEELGKLNPSAIVVWNYQEEEIKQLEALKVPTIALKYGTMEDLQNGIRVIGKVLGKEDRAEEIIGFQKDTMAYFDGKKAALADKPKPKVLYLYDENLKVAGGKAVNTMMIETAGGANAAKEVDGTWVNVTMEQVAAWNPDVVILSNFSPIQPSDLTENKLEGQNWSNIAAVREGRVWKAPVGLYRWDAPCVETPLMIKWLGQKLHPDVFNDYVLADDMRSFYEKFFGYQLTDEDLKFIFHE